MQTHPEMDGTVHATQTHCLGCPQTQEDTTDSITGLGLGTLERRSEEGVKEMGGP